MPKPVSPQINWNNPLTKGLVFDEPYTEGGGSPSDLISTKKGTFNSDVTWARGVYGKVVDFGGTTGKESRITLSTQNSLTASTIQAIYLARSYSSGGNFPRLFMKGPNTVGYFEISFTSSNLIVIQSRWNGGVNNPGFSTNAPSLNNWHNVIGTYDGSINASGFALYADGLQLPATTPTNGAGTRDADSTDLTIGGRLLDTARAFNGQVVLIRYWNRILTRKEITMLYDNPWQIYTQPVLLPTVNIQQILASTNQSWRNLLGVGI